MGAVVVRDRSGEERLAACLRLPVVPGGQGASERLPRGADAAPPVSDNPEAGDDRPRLARLGLRLQLLEFLIQEFVVFLLPAPEHQCRNHRAEEREQAQDFLHGSPPECRAHPAHGAELTGTEVKHIPERRVVGTLSRIAGRPGRLPVRRRLQARGLAVPPIEARRGSRRTGRKRGGRSAGGRCLRRRAGVLPRDVRRPWPGHAGGAPADLQALPVTPACPLPLQGFTVNRLLVLSFPCWTRVG